jgi:Tropinone reductase 1
MAQGSELMQGWNLKGYRALVTGGSQGIGRAIAQELRGHGAEVWSVALDEGEVVADLGTEAGRLAVLESLPADWTALDILVNNAGINVRKPTAEYTLAEYQQVQRVNQEAMHEMCRLLYPRLKASGRGSVVNIGSVAGNLSVGTSAVYAMTKAAVAHLSRYLAVEWAPDRIRVNAIAPGWVATKLTERIQHTPEAMQLIEARTPLGRMGRPEEIAAVAAFLCLPVASYLTGAVIPVDGAMSAYGMDMTAALRQAG